MAANVDQQLLHLLETGWQDPTSGMERMKALLAQGAAVSPAETLPPIFLALHALNAPAVKVLLEAGASLDTPLVHPWLDYDDEGEIVLARAGTTARQFYARFEQEERAYGKLPQKRDRWLTEVSALLRDSEPAASMGKKAPTKSPTKSTAKTAAKPEGLDGRWREIDRRITDEGERRRVPLKSGGGLLVIQGDAFTQEGTGLGLPRKGKLTTRKDQRFFVEDDLAWSFVLLGERLEVTSPADADEEHGQVQESTFERETKAKKR